MLSSYISATAASNSSYISPCVISEECHEYLKLVPLMNVLSHLHRGQGWLELGTIQDCSFIESGPGSDHGWFPCPSLEWKEAPYPSFAVAPLVGSERNF